MSSEMPNMIIGGAFSDERGTISFVNDFLMHDVKRLYHIHHDTTAIVRAWQGHRFEQKWFYVLEGTFNILLVKPDHWTDPSADLQVLQYEVNALTGVLHVPGGYASGIKAQTPSAKMIVFSDSSVEESNNDNYRFDKNLWVDWTKI